ncbi:MAG: hypothetical protein O7D91_05460 [Planctomycetota bacterium]|nr:hypothetical protein [Planctomycetota bacterium]
MQGHRSQFSFIVVFVSVIVGLTVARADAQLGIITSTIGSGSVTYADGSAGDWRIGQPIGEGDRITTDADSYAMLFFVSGLGVDDIDFEGTIVVEIDQNSIVEIRRGQGRRAPIDVYIVKGGVQAFFDAGEHKDYILLSTAQGELQVTGSHIYATYALPGLPGSVFGSFDSDCEVRMMDGTNWAISRNQKVVVNPNGDGGPEGITPADKRHWDSLPDLNLAAAMAHRGRVQTAYADRTWVGGWIAGAERLEDVAGDQGSNIPSQEPELVSVAPTTTVRTTGTSARDNRPRLRGTRTGSLPNQDDGTLSVDRGTSQASQSRLRNSTARVLDGPSGLRSARSRRSAGAQRGAIRPAGRK